MSQPIVSTLGRHVIRPRVPPGTTYASPEHVSRIVGRTGVAQQRHKLLLEAPLSMMLSLTRDVIGYNLLLRLADAEGSVPFLPLEPHSALVKPSRTVALQLLNGLGQRNGGRNGDQKVDVVGRASGGNQCDLLRASHPGQISSKLDRIGYEVGALFRAEYAMHEHPGVSVGHRIRLSARLL